MMTSLIGKIFRVTGPLYGVVSMIVAESDGAMIA